MLQLICVRSSPHFYLLPFSELGCVTSEYKAVIFGRLVTGKTGFVALTGAPTLATEINLQSRYSRGILTP